MSLTGTREAVIRRFSATAHRSSSLERLTCPGSIELPEGIEMVMPGDNVCVTVTLQKPVAIEQRMEFSIREGGRTVGAGRVAEVAAS